MFLLILLGMYLHKRGFMSETTTSEINNVVFVAFLPCLLFYNIFETPISIAAHAPLIAFTIICVLIIWILATAAVCAVEKRPAKRGAMIQGVYRSNYTLFGLSLIIGLYGHGQAGVSSFMIIVILPMFNILAVVTLELFRGGKIRPIRMLINIAKNPLIIGSALGFVAALFRIPLPDFIVVGIASVASLASPLALVIIGASLSINKRREGPAPLVFTTIGRLIVVPGIALPAAAAFGFTGVELATLIALFASPTAISAYPMAVQMNSDGELTAETIVLTTLFSCVTVFSWIFGFKQLGLI